jgi:hypothetical protein
MALAFLRNNQVCHARIICHGIGSATNTRFLGTTSGAEQQQVSCPYNHNASATPPTPKLQVVKALPVIDSLLPMYSGIPDIDPMNLHEFFPAMRHFYGNFYKMGFPSLGKESRERYTSLQTQTKC